MNPMPKKTALITGASTGIGRDLAVALAGEGYQLILMARRLELLNELKSEILIKNSQSQVEVVVSDVADFETHMKTLAAVCEKYSSLDLVIANAGVGGNTDETNNTWAMSKKIIDVNLLGAIATLEAAKEIMMKQGHGQLVGLTSIAAARGMNFTSAYNASKAGLSTFLESMRIDLSGSGLSVTAVYPGFVATPMTAKNGKMMFVLTSQQAVEIILKAIRRKKARIYFPWQMALAFTLLRFIPNGLYDFIMKRLKSRVQVFRQDRG